MKKSGQYAIGKLVVYPHLAKLSGDLARADAVMKVLLIQPNSPGCDEQVAITEPLGICMLSALLEQKGISSKVVHQVSPHYLTDEGIVELAKEYKPDCVGISTITENFPSGLNLSKKIRKALDVPIIFGGNHVTSYPEAAREPSIDVVALGHAIETFPELVEQLARGGGEWRKNPWIAYEENGELRVGSSREFVVDIDSLPFYRRDDLPIHLYKVFPMLMLPPSRQRVLSMYTAWGCKCRCEFCMVPKLYDGKWFAQSPRRVLDELRFIKDRFDVNFVHFHDDDFCADEKRAEEICQGMIDEGLNIKFGMMTRFDHLHEELFSLMERAGLILVSLGIETGTSEGLKKISKGISLETIRQKLEMVKNRGIQINGNYMVGFPWESRETMDRALRFLLTIPLDTLGVNFFIPFKELEIRKTMEEEGLIEGDDFSKYSFKETIVRTRFLTRGELENSAKRIITRFYFRISYFWWLLRRIARRPYILRSIVEVFVWGVSRRSRLLAFRGLGK